MKNKFTFSKAGIKDFFFRHTEKLFFGLACGLILFFVWFGLKTPKFEEITPKQMLAKSEEANKYIQDTTHWDNLQKHRTADTEAVKRINEAKAVDPADYTFRQLSGTAIYTLAPRRDPALIPVQKFETRLVRAQFATNLGRGDSESKLSLGLKELPDSVMTLPQDHINESFMYRANKLKDDSRVELKTIDAVVGLGIIDHQQQLTNYIENFQYQRGYDTVRDVPEYSLIEVQRKTENTDWRSITAHVYTISRFLAEEAKELGSEDYILPNVALPIPPMLGIDYRQFSMLDEIPTREVFEDVRAQQKQSREEDNASNSDEDPFGNSGQSGSDSKGSDTKGSDTKSGSDTKTDPESKMMKKDGDDSVIPTRLVRFYDLQEKQPGETYYYRIRLWVKDPNNPEAVNADIAAASKEGKKSGGIGLGGGAGAGNSVDGPGSGGGGGGKKEVKIKKPLSEFDLSGEVRDRVNAGATEIPTDVKGNEKLIETEKLFAFSRPTEWVEADPVTITKGFETFVSGPIGAPSSQRIDGGIFATSEPTVEVVVNSFLDDLGVFVPAKTSTLRGSLLNFEAVTNLLDPLTWTIKEVFASEDNKGRKSGRRFKSDALVLDIMGGERLGRGKTAFKAPGECLIMDRNGRIRFHNEIEDSTRWRHANFTSEANRQALEEASGKKKDDDDDNDSGGRNN